MKKLLLFLLVIIFGFESFSQCIQPRNLRIYNNYSDSTHLLTWSPGDNIQTLWEIQASIGDSNFIDYNSYVSSSNSYIINNLIQGVEYYIRVRGACMGDFSPYSKIIKYKASFCNSPVISNIKNITSISAELDFIIMDSNSIGWELGYRINNSESDYTVVSLDTNYYKFENLNPNTSYDYYLKTICSDEDSPMSSIKQFTTSPLVLNALTNNKTFYSDGEYIYDDGGELGDHGNNYNYSVKICPKDNEDKSKRIALRFDEFSLGNGDYISLKSGGYSIVVDNNLYFTNNFLNGKTAYSRLSDTTGCISINFTTNTTGSSTGFKAYAYCEDRCQKPIADLDTFYAKIDKNLNYNTYSFKYITDSSQLTQFRVIDFCEGDSVILFAKPKFPENLSSYPQDAASCKYIWSYGDGNYATTNFKTSYKWNEVGIYNLDLTVIDTNALYLDENGCKSSNSIKTIVRVSKNPIKNLSNIPDICSGQPFNLSSGYGDDNILTLDKLGTKQSPVFKDSEVLFIPDGQYSYLDNIVLPLNISAYAPNSTITSADDIISLCINMEHSYPNDLDISLTCPNGQNVRLKTPDQSTMYNNYRFLGIPLGGNDHQIFDYYYDSQAELNKPGIGWNYCFSNLKSDSNSTILNNCNTIEVSNPIILAEDCMVCDSTNKEIASSYYKPEYNFSSLIGCPKNGEWKIIINDYITVDNGFVFSWELELDSSDIEAYSYAINVDNVVWDSPYITSVNTFNSIFTPPFDSLGIYNTNISLIDEYGCVYDTNTSLNVIQSPETPSNLNLSFQGNNIQLTWEGSSNQYQVYRDDSLIAEVNLPIYIDNNMDTTSNYCYKVIALGEECNSAFSDKLCSLIGLEDEIRNDLSAKLYPNPTNGKTILEINGLNTNSNVLVYDLKGRVLKTYKFNPHQDRLEIDASNLEKGIYYIRIFNNESSITKKLVVN